MMTGIWSNQEDLALLALVIREAAAVAAAKKGYIGRTAVQKLLYFAKVSGVKMGYGFDVYHYGPFCAEIMSDIEVLQAEGHVEDRSKKPDYSNYVATSEADALISKHLGDNDSVVGTVRSIAQGLAWRKPQDLELYSTLDYVFRSVRATGRPGPYKDAVIERFNAYKKGKFPDEVVSSTYDWLVGIGAAEA